MGDLKAKIKTKLVLVFSIIAIGLVVLIIQTIKAPDQVMIRFDIEQNQQAIYLSTFAEPPQFAVWIENQETSEKRIVFVTHRSGTGDWEGKPAVPVAVPRWSQLFVTKGDVKAHHEIAAVSGATPKEEAFSLSTEVTEGSVWKCWVEMNLAGDFNESFTEFNEKTLVEDEFFCGQPALLYSATITAENGFETEPQLVSQSVWVDGKNQVEPVSSAVTTARSVFETIKVSVSK